MRWLAPLALSLLGCAQAPTALVVVVDSDLTVPQPLALVQARVGGAGCTEGSCVHDFALSGAGAVTLPFSFTIVPAGGTGGAVQLDVVGRDAGGTDRVARHVETSFVAHHARLVRIVLERACLDSASCTTGETCLGGGCANAQVDPATLPDVEPGRELDGGVVHPDGGASLVDASDVDVGPDAAGDAGSLPRSCAALPSGSASGAYTIDPDGPGGTAPFLDWCETSADGGGWTLIARADPATTNLAYSVTRWTETSPTSAIGTADLSVSDALLSSYWTLPVHELRIVMADPATPAAIRSLVTALVPATPTTLRAAMEPSAGVTLDATQSEWATLVGAAAPGTATCEENGVGVGLPSTTPEVRVRIGYVWADTVDCTRPGFWAGIGADGTSCRPVASSAGGGRLCGTGAVRQAYRLAVWVFGR